eukprot:3686683-Rhodomonas_salina.1
MPGIDVACRAISLRVCYAVSGTKPAHSAMRACARYAMPGNDLACGVATGPRRGNTAADKEWIVHKRYSGTTSLRACYALSGTDNSVSRYLPTRCGTEPTHALPVHWHTTWR